MLNCRWASVNSAELQHQSHRELVRKAGSRAPLQTSWVRTWNLTRALAICVHQVWEALIQKTQKENSSILSASESNWNHLCESGPPNLSGLCFPTCKMKSMGLTCQHPFWLLNMTSVLKPRVGIEAFRSDNGNTSPLKQVQDPVPPFLLPGGHVHADSEIIE